MRRSDRTSAAPASASAGIARSTRARAAGSRVVKRQGDYPEFDRRVRDGVKTKPDRPALSSVVIIAFCIICAVCGYIWGDIKSKTALMFSSAREWCINNSPVENEKFIIMISGANFRCFERFSRYRKSLTGKSGRWSILWDGRQPRFGDNSKIASFNHSRGSPYIFKSELNEPIIRDASFVSYFSSRDVRALKHNPWPFQLRQTSLSDIGRFHGGVSRVFAGLDGPQRFCRCFSAASLNRAVSLWSRLVFAARIPVKRTKAEVKINEPMAERPSIIPVIPGPIRK